MLKNVILYYMLLLASCSIKKVCLNLPGQEVDWYAIFFMPASVSFDNEMHYGYFAQILITYNIINIM